jgi:phosphate transport system permease protein
VKPSAGPSVVRAFLRGRGSSAIADGTFKTLVFLCALSIFGIVFLIAFELVSRSQLTLSKFGLSFFFRSAWDPVNSNFGAWPFIYGTLMSSFLALLISVPFALGVAIFLTEMCPKWLRAPLSFLTELLAAIPSVVYGLWAIFVLIPLLRDYVNPKLKFTLGWTGCWPRAWCWPS